MWPFSTPGLTCTEQNIVIFQHRAASIGRSCGIGRRSRCANRRCSRRRKQRLRRRQRTLRLIRLARLRGDATRKRQTLRSSARCARQKKPLELQLRSGWRLLDGPRLRRLPRQPRDARSARLRKRMPPRNDRPRDMRSRRSVAGQCRGCSRIRQTCPGK